MSRRKRQRQNAQAPPAPPRRPDTQEIAVAHVTDKYSEWYEYKLTVLDRFGSPDKAFPALPQIKSKKQFQQGAMVAIALPYGELAPAIIGEVRL